MSCSFVHRRHENMNYFSALKLLDEANRVRELLVLLQLDSRWQRGGRIHHLIWVTYHQATFIMSRVETEITETFYHNFLTSSKQILNTKVSKPLIPIRNGPNTDSSSGSWSSSDFTTSLGVKQNIMGHTQRIYPPLRRRGGESVNEAGQQSFAVVNRETDHVRRPHPNAGNHKAHVVLQLPLPALHHPNSLGPWQSTALWVITLRGQWIKWNTF